MLITFLILLLALAIYVYNLPVFGGKAEGKRLVRMKQSPNYKEGVFQNLSFTPSLAEGFTMRKVLWEFLTDKTENKKPTSEERYAMKSKMLDEQIAFKADMKKILTEKQMEKWEEQKAERRENRMERKRMMHHKSEK